MYEIKKYPDNTSYAVVHPMQEFTFRVNSYEDLWHLNQIIDAQNNLGVIPTVTIPCLIDAQADRRFNNNESYGLKLVCKFLNQIKAEFRIFHPHNQEVVEALLDKVEVIDNTDFIKNTVKKLRTENFSQNTILFSSDAGGFKPLMKLCDKINWRGETFSASKARKYEDGKSKLTQEINKTDFGGKDILIVDDICVYGGTFKGLAKLLKERNCGKLYLAVSHLTVQNLGKDSVTNYFDKVFTTNSKGFEYLAEGTGHDRVGYKPENLVVVDMF